MKKVAGIIEGLILLVIGAYAVLLILSGNYWRFLNPKFTWLTAVTAIVLMLIGITAALKPNNKPSLARISIFLVLLIVLLSGHLGITAHKQIASKPPVGKPLSGQLSGQPPPQSKPPVEGDPFAGILPQKLPPQSPADQAPRVIMDGQEYVRINLAELYILFKSPQAGKLEQRYVVRGIVHRSKRLDRLQQFALLRNVVFCCLADSFGAGFRVQSDRLDKFADGQWLEVYGTLKRSAHQLPDPHLHIEDMRYYDLNESYVLVPSKIIPISEPDEPYIFECRTSEPFAY